MRTEQWSLTWTSSVAGTETQESHLIEKLVKIQGQTSTICKELIIDNNELQDAIVKLLYTLDISMKKIAIPETVKTRALLLTLMLKGSTTENKIRIEGRHVYIDNSDGGYRITLASGLIFTAKENRLLSVFTKM